MDARLEETGCPAVGEIIDGKYRVEKLLGQGGMGAVVKAFHVLRRAPVALKFMNPRLARFPGAIERFVNEAVAASRISNEHVVQIFDVGRLPDGLPYLVMEYLEGQDLAQIIARDGERGLPIERALHFTMQLLRGLEVAHGADIVHRDIKPSNCFVIRKEGQDDFVKVLDFGISKVSQPDSVALTMANAALGTPLYMSPEQARSPKDVDARSDIYSAGVILYELLTGRTPFTSESGELAELLAKVFSEPPEPIEPRRPDVPPELAAAVYGALARDREMRFPTVVHFAEALAPFIGPMTLHVLAKIRADLPGRMSLELSNAPIARPSAPAADPRTHAMSAHASMSTAPREAEIAETQFAPLPSMPPPEARAVTDLGAVNDAPVTKPARGARYAWLALAALVVLGGAAALSFVGNVGSAAPVSAPPSTPITATLEREPAFTASPDPTASPSAPPSAETVVKTPPSAAPTSLATAPAPPRPPVTPPPPARRTNDNPLDIRPIE